MLKPLDFRGDCLSELENELHEILEVVRKTARKLDADIVMVGTLPTVQQSDYVAENLTPLPRYKEMNRVLTEMSGGERVIHIKGLDEFQMTFENTFIEFSNTSFQVHFQVGISEYVELLQLVAGDCRAGSRRRRQFAAAARTSFVARNQNRAFSTRDRCAFDGSSSAEIKRRALISARNGLKDSLIEVFQEDVGAFSHYFDARNRRRFARSFGKRGNPASSRVADAQRLRSGVGIAPVTELLTTNRVCESKRRFLPAGPTVVDEIANSAFFLGLMTALPEEFGDVREKMSFDDAKNNFFNVAQNGLNTQITWFDGKIYSTRELDFGTTFAARAKGLEKAEIDGGGY